MDLQKKIWDKDREILQLAARLHNAEVTLQTASEDIQQELQAITVSQSRAQSVSGVVDYSYLVAYITGPLPGFTHSLPPFPTDLEIVNSHLSAVTAGQSGGRGGVPAFPGGEGPSDAVGPLPVPQPPPISAILAKEEEPDDMDDDSNESKDEDQPMQLGLTFDD